MYYLIKYPSIKNTYLMTRGTPKYTTDLSLALGLTFNTLHANFFSRNINIYL